MYNGESGHSPRRGTLFESALLLQATIEEVPWWRYHFDFGRQLKRLQWHQSWEVRCEHASNNPTVHRLNETATACNHGEETEAGTQAVHERYVVNGNHCC